MAVDSAADELHKEVEHLRRENALLAHFLERTKPDARAATAPAKSTDATADEAAHDDGEALLPAEKYELCAVEIEAARKEIEQVKLDGELEQARLAAVVADARTQEAALRKDIAELLKLVGLSAGGISPGCSMSTSGAASAGLGSVSAPPTDTSAPAGQAEAEPAASPSASPPPAPKSRQATPSTLPLALPSAKQLARATIPAAWVEAFLEAYLARHDASAVRLQMRCGMLRTQLAKLAGQRAAREGASLTTVDYEQRQIQHSQAETAMRVHSEEATALKAELSTVLQQLGALRQALAVCAANSARKLRELEDTEAAHEGQADVLERVERECSSLTARCASLKRTVRGAGGKVEADEGSDDGSPRILAYIQVKNDVCEAQKRVQTLEHRLELAVGRQQMRQ